jgi:O-antigen ligase
MVIVTAWSIGWHIANGYWSGWKRLLDPKATFTFMPLLFGLMIVAREGARRGRHWFGWCFLGSVILASGERKALIIYAVLSAALIARGRLLSSLHVVGGAFLILVMLSGIIEDPYLSRQIRSVVHPFDSGDFSAAIATGEARQGDTRSNAQRGFALVLAGDLISQNMFVGVGTNEYERIIAQRYRYLPEFLRAGIHGEFLRILTENGLIGLLSYLAVWLVALLRTRATLRAQLHAGLLTASQAALLQIVAFVPCLLYVSFEASGTHSIVVLTFISLLPEGLTAWRERSNEEPAPAMRTVPRRQARQAVVARQGILGGSS